MKKIDKEKQAAIKNILDKKFESFLSIAVMDAEKMDSDSDEAGIALNIAGKFEDVALAVASLMHTDEQFRELIEIAIDFCDAMDEEKISQN